MIWPVRDAPARASILAAGLAVAILGLSVASAQERVPANLPGKLTVTTRMYDLKALTAPSGLAEDAIRGRGVWVQQCAWCHDGVGQPTYKTMGPFLGADLLQMMGEDKVRASIAKGSRRMPGFQYALKPQQVDELIAFLRTVAADQKPTASQLAGKAEAAQNGGE